ncbi:pyridoxamine 5'-phosphate oxidase family protein [Paraburkholderia sp. J94]|uniref:pyridoxamine 5'-phosphate oxidase family protein n=1 Tax=Paraburkholderia sp. J94 TaxID=2805441 RepID=UPI002AAF112F|nr:pyridoxamine 5'-phosphate oxidase family protein [Paraburkholderia sp. J94]
MNALPPAIADVLNAHHVLSLAVCSHDVPWAANAFFAFDEASASLAVLGHLDTQHARMLLANCHVAGTVAGQPAAVDEIVGVQFYGLARVVEDEAERRAGLALYHARFPFAQGMAAPLWRIHLLRLKLTDNRTAFGSKTTWERHSGDASAPSGPGPSPSPGSASS